MKWKYASGGGSDLRLRRITSSPSQTLRQRLVRTTDDGRRSECSARRLPPFVAAFFSHFATRTVDNTVDLMQRSQILVQNRVFAYSTAFVRGFPSEYRHPVWHGKTRMAWLPNGKKNFEDIFICFDATHESDRQTDGQTDRHHVTA